MNNVPEAVLYECLDLMERGESIEQIIARYPEMAEGLRPFLETADQLAKVAPQPSLAAKQKSQKAFLAHAQSLNVTPVRPSPWYRLRQILLPIASLALVLILFATTAVSVSVSAIPGDALYPVKRLVENVRLNQAADVETAVALMEQYREERIREVQALLRTGRSAEVVFEGEVTAMQPEQWRVAEINVLVDAQTIIMGTAQIGDTARVNGRTENGKLIANTIEIITHGSPPPEATNTPEPLPSATVAPATDPTAEPEPTKTATTSPTRQPTATQQPTAVDTPSVTPAATATPSPMPTPTASPTDDDGNDNNSNDNNDNNSNDGGNSNDDNENENDDNENEGNENEGGGNENGGSNNNGSNENGSNDNDDDDNDNNDNDNSNNGNSNDNDNDNDDDDE